MQLRYSFRLYPDTAQAAALARAFGCARVVFVRREVALSERNRPSEEEHRALL
ncbi:helix-turn-helix domain-containing protein [Streptomyces sp. NPDC051001]|uniref:helix-turn-helix domain-containing protein n=1 Tax=Streptomyces sp. NPDC051001 TaxID=3155795 RepID=UPI003440C884